MGALYLPGYALRLLLEASVVPSDPGDDTRYYKLEAAMDSGAARCRYSAKDSSGTLRSSTPTLGLKLIDTNETLGSDQNAMLAFNGGAELAKDLVERTRSMDRLRIELTSGTGWRLAFDGFLTASARRSMSAPEHFSSEITLSAGGLWKFLAQSLFNWQGAIQPGYDVFLTPAGNNLFKKLAEHQTMPGQEIIRAFIETALSLVELKTGEGLIQPGKFFTFGTGKEWQSAFDIGYPMPAKTLPTWRGTLAGMIQLMAQPDIHECFATYRSVDGRERPTIIFRPRPFPGAEGDDAGWEALTVHTLKDEPAAKTIMANRNDGQHPNAFHWAQGSSSDSSFTDYEQKILRGFMVDSRSLKRYGYAARPVTSTMPPLSQIQKDQRGKFVDTVQDIMQRIAYQEAPLPELWTRTIQLPLRPGIHAGDVVEEYSSGVPWTGYVSTVHHRLTADPWGGSTNIGMVRCLQCTAKDYPKKVRALVAIEFKKYTAPTVSGAADAATMQLSRKTPIDTNNPAAQPVANVPWGKGILEAAKARGVPPWVLAHACHIESAFGTHPNTIDKGGMMQFTRTTANDLNNQGYDKPFNFEIAKSDPERSLDAAAWYLAKIRKQVDGQMPSNLDDNAHWAWTLYGYNRGPSAALVDGMAQGWEFSAADKATTQHSIYWGLGPVQQARAQFGGLQ